MATTVEKYLAGCQKVVDAKPKYVNGASGLDECDCIGMDKYSFRENGVEFSSTGTNYTFRHQVEDIRPIVGTSDLEIGEVVFKFRKPGEKGYNLPEKYQKGGSDYNGDLNDYYHIGTVMSVYPLRIAHMTTPTAKVDITIGKWGYAAKWLPQYIKSYKPTPEPEPIPEPIQTPETATVWAENGKPVNLRKRPSKAAALVDRVPCGDFVEIIEKGTDWCHVRWKNKVGYMITEFLILPDDVLYTVMIPHLTYEQAEALKDMYPGADAIEETVTDGKG